MLELTFDRDPAAYFPGEELSGRASWRFDASEDPPEKAEVRLFWYTEGKGTQDVGRVEGRTFSSVRKDDAQEFRLQLPDAPYSFSGKLVSLCWAVELVIQPGNRNCRRNFTLSPTGQELLLKDSGKDAWKAL